MNAFPLAADAATPPAPHDERVPIRPSRLLVAGLLSAIAFVALYLVSNRTAAGQALENSWARQYDTAHTTGYLLDEAHVVPPFHLDIATVVAGILLAVAVAAARHRWREAALVAVAAPAAIAAGAVFKALTGRPRLVASLDVDPSYPSGHAGIALAVSAALLVVLPERQRRWAAPLLGGWCLLTCAGLQAEGQHRASEILGSGLLTAAVFCLVGAVVLRSERAPVPAAAVRPSLGALAAAAVVAVVGAWSPVPWQIAVEAAAGLVATGLSVGSAAAVRARMPGSEVTAEPVERPLQVSGP